MFRNRTIQSSMIYGLLVLPGLLAFIGYWITLPSTLQVGDAGEQITAAHFLGVSHPTGTPLYLLLMKFWEIAFPFGTVVWRMNLLNAILGSITVFLFSALVLKICLFHRIPQKIALVLAVSASLVLAFSKTYWYESTSASSYLLHSLFVVSWLYIIVRIVLEKNLKALCFLYFLTGMALANHILSVILLILTFLYSTSLALRKEISLRRLGLLHCNLIPGLLIYLYVPLRAAADPPVNWGDPDSFAGFLSYILRQDYQYKVYVSSLSDFLEVIGFHLKSYFLEMSPILTGLAFVSTIALTRGFLKKGGESFWATEHVEATNLLLQLVGFGLLLMLLNLVFVSLHGSHTDIFYWKRYMITGYIGILFSSVVLVVLALRYFSGKYLYLCTTLFVVMPLISFFQHFEKNDRSPNTLLESFSDKVFSHLPEGATFYASGDIYLFASLYYHLVEKRRPDLRLLNPKLGIGNKSRIAVLIKEGKLYSSHYFKTELPVKLVPDGLVFKFVTGPEPDQKELSWEAFTEVEVNQARSFHEKILLVDYYFRRAVYHKKRGEGQLVLFWLEKMPLIAEACDRALVLTGRAFAEMGKPLEALNYFREALKINPRNRAAHFFLETLKNKKNSSKRWKKNLLP